ncbi:NTPase [Campylobacter coli]|nr:NTPase [Campylobacter coli]
MENNIKIKVTDISRLNEQYKEAIQLGTYDGEDVEKFFNTIKLFDIAESSELKKDFSNQYIGFEIITKKEKIPLDIRLGEGNFEKGIKHLIDIGATNITKDIPEHSQKQLNNYLQPYSKKSYDEMLDGTFKAIKNLSDMVNKDLGAIILEFADSYSNIREKHHKKEHNKTNNMPQKSESFFKEKFSDFFKKKLNSILPKKERSNEKIHSRVR